MTEKTIDGIIPWLKNWFYDISQINTLLGGKVNLNQGQANKNVVTNASGEITVENKPTIDSAMSSTSTNAVQNKVVNTALGNKVDKTNGANQMTDSSAYSRLGTSAGATQKTINNAINTKIGQLLDVELLVTVTTLPTASADTMNKLYLVLGGTYEETQSGDSPKNLYSIYVTVRKENNSGYRWEKVDDADLQGFMTTTTANNTFAPKNHVSNTSTYGLATDDLYGHVKLIDDPEDIQNETGLTNGHALSAHAGKEILGIISTINQRFQPQIVRMNVSDPNVAPSLNDYNYGDIVLKTSPVGAVLYIKSTDSVNDFWVVCSNDDVLNSRFPFKSEAVTDIELVPKATDSTGAIKLIFADE